MLFAAARNLPEKDRSITRTRLNVPLKGAAS
jgi:hypothetical protein